MDIAAPLPFRRILVFGDVSSGKDILIRTFVHGAYSPTPNMNVRIDFYNKEVVTDGAVLRLQIFDVNVDRMTCIAAANFLRGADGIILTFNVDEKKSFTSIKNWVTQSSSKLDQNVPMALVGNVYPISHREVAREEGMVLARELKVAYLETCVETNHNVQEVFNYVCQAIVKGQPALPAEVTAQQN